MTLMKRNGSLFPSLWNDFFDYDFGMPNFAEAGTSIPAVNVIDKPDNYEIEMAAPGMKKEDFQVSIENRMLTISSELKSENTEQDKNGQYTRREFNYRSFKRSFHLPDSSDSEKIFASYQDGVLRIQIPKKEEAKPKPAKQIEIM